MSADYSQIELRLLAHFSQDPLLLDAYRTGKDIHTLTAAEVFEVDAATMDKETRARAKAVNFGIVYGISPFGLAAQLGIEQKIAKAYIEKYFERYAGVAKFIEATLDQVRREGSVRTYFGRVRPIPDIQSRNPNQRGFAERTAINTPLQGTAADLIKIAMLRIDAEITRRKLRSADDPPGPRRTALRRRPRRSRRDAGAGQEGDGVRRRVLRADRRRGRAGAKLARYKVTRNIQCH